MNRTIFFTFIIAASTAFGQNDPVSILRCKCNAKANRDFLFTNKEWVDQNNKPSTSFGTGTRAEPNGLVIYDKIFAGLTTNNPIVKSFALKETTRFKVDDIAEFSCSVLERGAQTVVITWKNPHGNKIWIAAIDLKNKKAIVTQLYEGLFSMGVDVETLDCE